MKLWQILLVLFILGLAGVACVAGIATGLISLPAPARVASTPPPTEVVAQETEAPMVEPTPDPAIAELKERAKKLENALAECGDRGIVQTADGYACKSEPTPMPAQEIVSTPEPEAKSVVTEEPVQMAGLGILPEVGGGGNPGYSISGVPDKAENVLVTECPDPYGNCFKNTTGLGSQGWFAEPGSILYGPDESADIVKGNPHGDYFNPITQVMLVFPEADISIGEGAFIFATAREMTVKMRDVTVKLDGADQHIWFLVVRGLFADNTNDDRNVTAHFSGYVVGHAQVMRHPAGAFISEEQFLQMVETGHTNHYTSVGGEAVAVSSRNCGDTGCNNDSFMLVDLNTGAYTVLNHTEGGDWQFVASNWLIP